MVRHFFLFMVAAICLSRPVSVLAFDDWLPVTPDELKMKADPAHPTDAVILYHEETSDDNKNHRMTYLRLKIFTERGRYRGNVEVPYIGSDFHVIDVKGRTISPDGTITPFTGKVFDKSIVKGHGIKFLAKTFALPNVQPGCIVEWKYTEYWGDNTLYAPHWTIQEDLLQKRAKFTFIPYVGSRDVVGEHGVANRVYYTTLNLPKDVSIKQLGEGRMEMELKDVPAFEAEELSPPEDFLRMRVDFFYGTEKMAKPAEFWKEQGKYWNKVVNKFMGHSSAVAAAAAQDAGTSGGTEQKVRRIYTHVQKLNNLSYNEQGFLAKLVNAETQPINITAEDVLKNGSGKKDELTRLFVAMVRAANVPAFVMRVAPRDRTFFQMNFPSWRQLTSEIAIVNIDGRDVFLDPGTRFCPFGLLEWPKAGVYGVRQTPDGNTALVTTPPPDYTQTLTLRVARATLAGDGSLKGTVKISWTGQEALSRRIDASETDEAGRKRDLEDEVRSELPPGAVVELKESAGWTEPNGPLSATFQLQAPSYASATGKRLIFTAGLFQSGSKPVFSSPERKYPVHLSFPYRIIDDIQITLPENLKVESLPQTQPINTEFAVYRWQRSTTANSLSFRRDFAIAGMAFPLEYYAQLRTFFAGVNNGDSQQVVLSAGK